MDELRINPDDAGLGDVCPACGRLILDGHPPHCPFYDLLDAITLELEVEETYRLIRDNRPSPDEFRAILLRFFLDDMPDPPPDTEDV